MTSTPKLLEIESPSDIESAIDQIYDHVMNNGYNVTRNDPSRADQLRISSFPFCSRAYFLSQPLRQLTRSRVSVIGSNFTTIGTAFHENVQQGVENLAAPPPPYAEKGSDLWKIHFLPRGALLVQAWRCKGCGHHIHFSPYPTDPCPYCGGEEWRGDEHALSYGKHTHGHMDGTFAFPHEKGAPYSKKWIHIPIDYKTASANKLDKGVPFLANVEQILSYGAIKRHDGYNVPGCCLIYATRDNPFKRKVCYLPVHASQQLRKIDEWEVQFAKTKNARTLEEGMALPPRKVPDGNYQDHCTYCQFANICKEADKGNTNPLKAQVNTTVHFFKGQASKRVFPKL